MMVMQEARTFITTMQRYPKVIKLGIPIFRNEKKDDTKKWR